ncbi:WYL domain-containing protein [Ancylobacter sp. WKF20]|uniref:WYL domain-containing protein n=1 Tax=Ancylobacter sp. WKF20 TaxID=3039801 RepID=UPI00243466A9|nr:WYL domain-containing protein [Ancylobacter sp. WKF20]WGD31207.1 WYL domain-containing protein [Ancylobacter sp. WKF20]
MTASQVFFWSFLTICIIAAAKSFIRRAQENRERLDLARDDAMRRWGIQRQMPDTPATNAQVQALTPSPFDPARPWVGRQHRPTDDPDSRPDNGKTWDEVFNRPVTDPLRFEIEYQDRDGVVTTRTIRPLSIHLIRYEPWIYIHAFCETRQEERSFHSERVLSARNLRTNRPIKDLGQFLRRTY